MNEVAFSYKERKQNNLDNMISFSNVNDLMFPGLPLAKEGTPVWSSINVTHNETVPTPSIPQGFVDSNDYLRHLVQKGTINRCGPLIPQNVKERINQELSLIEKRELLITFSLSGMQWRAQGNHWRIV